MKSCKLHYIKLKLTFIFVHNVTAFFFLCSHVAPVFIGITYFILPSTKTAATVEWCLVNKSNYSFSYLYPIVQIIIFYEAGGLHNIHKPTPNLKPLTVERTIIDVIISRNLNQAVHYSRDKSFNDSYMAYFSRF